MNRVRGKVAFVTGAARGQGRAHAIRLADLFLASDESRTITGAQIPVDHGATKV